MIMTTKKDATEITKTGCDKIPIKREKLQLETSRMWNVILYLETKGMLSAARCVIDIPAQSEEITRANHCFVEAKKPVFLLKEE